MCIHVYICAYIHVHKCTHIYIHICAHNLRNMYLYTYIWENINGRNTCTQIWENIYSYIYGRNKYTHTHTHTREKVALISWNLYYMDQAGLEITEIYETCLCLQSASIHDIHQCTLSVMLSEKTHVWCQWVRMITLSFLTLPLQLYRLYKNLVEQSQLLHFLEQFLYQVRFVCYREYLFMS